MQNQRGSAVVEMAIMLPVLIILFIGMIEFGLFIRTKNQMNIVANQVASVLYALRSDDLANDDIIRRVLEQAEALAKPLHIDQMTVRFCEWRPDQSLWRNYKRTDTITSSGGGQACNTDAIECASAHPTKDSGHGAFVQVTSCATYRPILTTKLFTALGLDVPVQTTAYIPMTDTNQTLMLAAIPAGGGATQENGCTSANCGPTPNPNPQPEPEPEPEPEPNPQPEPEPEEEESCTISVCDVGYEVTGSGADCACTKKVITCYSPQILDAATNTCVTKSTSCTAPYTYNASADRCVLIPKCEYVVIQNCYNGQPCAQNVCEECPAPGALLASSGACLAFPNCPSGQTYDYTSGYCRAG